MNRLNKLGIAMALSAPFTLADFRYDQSSRMTGGSMMAMMKMAAKFSKGALDPVNSTVSVKGNRMAMNHGKTATIYDLDKETITEINFEKREMSVTTFAEVKAFLDKTVLKGGTTETEIQVDVKETGKEEVVGGMKAKEYLVTMKVEAADPQTGKKGEMQFEMSNWLAPKLPGYQEVGDFYKRMGERMDMRAMYGGAVQAGMGKGMAEAAKKIAEMDGIPVLQITRMIPTDPDQLRETEAAQQAAGSQPQQTTTMPAAGQAAEQAAAQAATSAVANKMGRFGGLGSTGLSGLGGLKKKKQDAPPPPPEPAASAPATPEAMGVKGSFSSEVSMIEMTVDMKNHSNSKVDDSAFAIPAGFKTVKGMMQK